MNQPKEREGTLGMAQLISFNSSLINKLESQKRRNSKQRTLGRQKIS